MKQKCLRGIHRGVKIWITPLLFLFCYLKAQTNLIVNPSFEEYECIPSVATSSLTPPCCLGCCKNWKSIVRTFDYFSTYSSIDSVFPCYSFSYLGIPKNVIGYQVSKEGMFYVGGFLHVDIPYFQPSYFKYGMSEGMIGELLQSLQKNHVYEFTMYWRLANTCNRASNQLQTYFTPYNVLYLSSHFDSIPYYFPYHYPPQVAWDSTLFMTDTLNWVKLNACFIAQGGEKYVAIGNFRSIYSTKAVTVNYDTSNFKCETFNSLCVYGTGTGGAYYYINDLSLYDRGYYSGSAKCIKDTAICPNATLVIGNNIPDSARYEWIPAVSLSCSH